MAKTKAKPQTHGGARPGAGNRSPLGSPPPDARQWNVLVGPEEKARCESLIREMRAKNADAKTA